MWPRRPFFPDRWIRRAHGSDRANPGHFAKKSLDFTEINPRSFSLFLFPLLLLNIAATAAVSRARRRALHLPVRPPASALRLPPRDTPHRSSLRLAATSRRLASPSSRPPPAAPGSPSGLLARSAPLPRGAPVRRGRNRGMRS